MTRISRLSAAFALFVAWTQAPAATTEFCLEGELDLGVRLQGTNPGAGEFVPARFCVVTDDETDRVRFAAEGRSNPDMAGDFTVAYLPPDVVRLVTPAPAADLEFRPADIAAEAAAYRRLDPRRLLERLDPHAERAGPGPGDGWRLVHYPGAGRVVAVQIEDGRLKNVRTRADLPLRGTVTVVWHWQWDDAERPETWLSVDDRVVFRGAGRWRTLGDEEAAAAWRPAGNADPRVIPGREWPARVNMRTEQLADGAYIVHGVRTGFSHLVVDTGKGLVVGDAPAGWLELQRIPPADLVPGLGVSGLSEAFVDFLAAEFPGKPLRAVVLTHHHDDHAGGARAFAAAGADIYAPAAHEAFLERALNSATMPGDRLAELGENVDVLPVADGVLLAGPRNSIRILPLGVGPHVSAALGLHAVEAGLFFQSDLHLPGDDPSGPSPERAATECWFAAWAVENLPAATVVVGSHGRPETPVGRLAEHLKSAACSG